MTIDTEINLPPLPGALVDVETEARAYARAAVEADRQGRMPSDEEILALAECARVWVPMGSGPEKERSLQALRSLITTALSRYSSGLPAASAEPKWAYDKIDRFLRVNLGDDDYAEYSAALDALADDYDAAPVAQEPADGCTDADNCRRCQTMPEHRGDMLHAGIGNYPTATAASAEPSESVVLLDALSGLVKALRERHYGRMPDEVQAAYDKAWAIVFSSPVAAPVAQEPVGEVFTMEPLDGSGDVRSHVLLTKDLPAGTKVYAEPVAAQAQPVAFAKDGVLFWHGEHAAWRGFNGDLYLAAQAQPMVDMLPPATSRDRWIYQQGRLAERDPRTPGSLAAEVAAQAQPAMPPLTEAMRAVLRNEHCVYDSEDALYAALCDVAQAQPTIRESLKDAQDHDAGLADTQRAIIEAAERRGYERAIAEYAQGARAAKGE